MDFHKRAHARAKTRMKQDVSTATASPRVDERERSAAASRRSRPLSEALTFADITQLQRTLGNRMVGRLLCERHAALPQRQAPSYGVPSGHQPVIQREIIDSWDRYALQSLRQERERRINKGRMKPKGNKYERLTKEELDNLIYYHTHNRGVFQPVVAQQQMQQQFAQNNLVQQNLANISSAPLPPSPQQHNNNVPLPMPLFNAQPSQQSFSQHNALPSSPLSNSQPLFQTGQASQPQTATPQSQEPLFLPPRQLTAEELGWDPSMMPTDEEIEENANIEWKIKKGSTVKQLPVSFKDPIEFIEWMLTQKMTSRSQEGYKRLLLQLKTAKDQQNIPAYQGFVHQLVVTNHYESKNKVLGVEENQHGQGAYRGSQGEYVSADIVVSTKHAQSNQHPEKIVEVKYRPSSSYNEEYAHSTLQELSHQLEADLRETGKVKLWWYGKMPKIIEDYIIELVYRHKGFSFQTFALS